MVQCGIPDEFVYPCILVSINHSAHLIHCTYVNLVQTDQMIQLVFGR
jgi:hypothetical protein